MSKSLEKSPIQTNALSLINDYMGGETARMYADFYAHQEDRVILDSIRQLLNEYLGNKKAHDVLIKRGLTNEST